MEGERQIPNYRGLIGLTLGQLLEKVTTEVPEKEALVYRDQRVTYWDSFRGANRSPRR